jgi:hypothetical protein
MTYLINQYIQVTVDGQLLFYLPSEIVGVRVKGTNGGQDPWFFVAHGSGRLIHTDENDTFEFAFSTGDETFIIPMTEILGVSGYPVEGGEDGLI